MYKKMECTPEFYMRALFPWAWKVLQLFIVLKCTLRSPKVLAFFVCLRNHIFCLVSSSLLTACLSCLPPLRAVTWALAITLLECAALSCISEFPVRAHVRKQRSLARISLDLSVPLYLKFVGSGAPGLASHENANKCFVIKLLFKHPFCSTLKLY